jgi:hypothetical protein
VSREVTFYTRRQCGLCDEALTELRALRDDLRFELRERDIDADAALRARFTDVVPVVAVGDRIIAQGPIDPAALRAQLEAALG